MKAGVAGSAAGSGCAAGWSPAKSAAATLILSGAALLGRSYVALQDVDPASIRSRC